MRFRLVLRHGVGLQDTRALCTVGCGAVSCHAHAPLVEAFRVTALFTSEEAAGAASVAIAGLCFLLRIENFPILIFVIVSMENVRLTVPFGQPKSSLSVVQLKKAPICFDHTPILILIIRTSFRSHISAMTHRPPMSLLV